MRQDYSTPIEHPVVAQLKRIADALEESNAIGRESLAFQKEMMAREILHTVYVNNANSDISKPVPELANEVGNELARQVRQQGKVRQNYERRT